MDRNIKKRKYTTRESLIIAIGGHQIPLYINDQLVPLMVGMSNADKIVDALEQRGFKFKLKRNK